MDLYLLKYINNINKNIETYAVKGSLCLYFHYITSISGEPNKKFTGPNDIDIDVFYIEDWHDVLLKCTKCFFNIDKLNTSDLKFGKKDVLYQKNNAKLELDFENVTIDNIKRDITVLKYFDEDGNNYIDLFLHKINEDNIDDEKNKITTKTYQGKNIQVLSFNTIIYRYTKIYTDPNEERLKKIPATINRFSIFYNETDNKHYKKQINEFLNFIKKYQKGGFYKYKYKKYKQKYKSLPI